QVVREREPPRLLTEEIAEPDVGNRHNRWSHFSRSDHAIDNFIDVELSQQILRPVEPAVVENEDVRRGRGGLGYQRQEEPRLIEFGGPESQPFHYQVGAFR